MSIFLPLFLTYCLQDGKVQNVFKITNTQNFIPNVWSLYLVFIGKKGTSLVTVLDNKDDPKARVKA